MSSPGAGGWVGRGVLHVLRRRFGPGWATRVQVYGSAERPLTASDGTMLDQHALEQLTPHAVLGAYVLHLAFLGRERCAGLGETAFRAANRRIDDAVLAAVQGAAPRGVFVASSGAARMTEQGLDPHPYGFAKLEQEARFAEAAARMGAPLYAGRIYSLAGPYMNKLDSYALSSFLLQAARTGRISIEARRPVFRAYLHVLDLARLALGALEQDGGWNGPVDLCGSEVVEMQDVARAVAKAMGLPRSAILREPLEPGQPSAFLGDPVIARTMALRQGLNLRPFAAQVADTVRWVVPARADRLRADVAWAEAQNRAD